MRAFARHHDGTVFVYVSPGLAPGDRLAAIREALRAAPDAGWRSGRHPVLLPALAGGAGLRRAPEGRWSYWALLTAAVAVTAIVIAMTMLRGSGAPHAAAGLPTALQPGVQSSPGPDQARWSGRARSSPAPPGSLPGQPAARKSSPGAPTPQASGTPVPVPTPGASPPPAPSPPRQPQPRPRQPPSALPPPGSSPSPWPTSPSSRPGP